MPEQRDIQLFIDSNSLYDDWRILLDIYILEILEKQASRDGFQLDKYMREHLYMVTGETVNVTMKIHRGYIGDFIDWYGKDFSVIKREPKEITIRFSVNDTALIFWALQYGKRVTIISPDSVREKMQKEVQLLADKYLPKNGSNDENA